ncbi:polyadenylate-binding protein 2-like [Dorcoceras hygrometricum]|uniref:Polyadenylate-binding protein 2-like n=1 Tax=Dorcoceras hygrometricum TaxID=472368 RepID=A0A2Z7B9J6_9LAMI|nr:polyadenylate-binding protein 2-like [Dorcoceras hygrometricum]
MDSNGLKKGDVFAHLTSFTQASKSSTKRSFLARGVQRYHSYFRRSYLPSAIGEDKVPVEDLIYTSCTDPIPQPTAARTPRLHQPSAVTHLFYAYVRKATNTEFNVVVL